MTKPKITPKRLAQDVLALLAAKKIIATSGEYYRPSPVTVKSCSPYLQKAIQQKPFKCYTCAAGAMFVAHVGLVDDANTADDYDRRKLLAVFGNDQLDLIEGAFERWGVPFGGSGALRMQFLAATEFGGRYPTNRARLVAIMKNIVKHGAFRPEAK